MPMTTTTIEPLLCKTWHTKMSINHPETRLAVMNIYTPPNKNREPNKETHRGRPVYFPVVYISPYPLIRSITKPIPSSAQLDNHRPRHRPIGNPVTETQTKQLPRTMGLNISDATTWAHCQRPWRGEKKWKNAKTGHTKRER